MESITPSISGLATNTALAALKSDLENKILDVSSLLQKTDCNTKLSEIQKKVTDHNHGKIPELNNLTTEYFAARLKQANLNNKDRFWG